MILRQNLLVMPQSINSFVSLLGFVREVAQPGRALESTNMLGRWRRCRGLPMVGFILACLGHRYRAVAGSNPALPTTKVPRKLRKIFGVNNSNFFS